MVGSIVLIVQTKSQLDIRIFLLPMFPFTIVRFVVLSVQEGTKLALAIAGKPETQDVSSAGGDFLNAVGILAAASKNNQFATSRENGLRRFSQDDAWPWVLLVHEWIAVKCIILVEFKFPAFKIFSIIRQVNEPGIPVNVLRVLASVSIKL